MDIEKWIKRMKCPQIQSCPMDGEYPSCKACQKSIQQEAATALSTLQAENEKLRAELEQVKQCVDGKPAADVAPVRHGRWIEDERTYPGPGLKNNLCSVCGEIAGSWKEGLEPGRKWAYCPNCGARMDKEDEHEIG